MGPPVDKNTLRRAITSKPGKVYQRGALGLGASIPLMTTCHYTVAMNTQSDHCPDDLSLTGYIVCAKE